MNRTIRLCYFFVIWTLFVAVANSQIEISSLPVENDATNPCTQNNGKAPYIFNDTKVSVFVLTNLGPLGEAYAFEDVGGFIKVSKKLDGEYRYPSLYFDVSASPLLVPLFKSVGQANEESTEKARKEIVKKYEEIINKVINKDREMEWMDIAIQLFPTCKKDNGTPDNDNDDTFVNCDDDNSVRLIEILPNGTKSGVKDSTQTQIASAISELATLSLPFYATSSFGVKSEAASKGLTVLFRNLFPPKVVTYQHTYIDNERRFGWNFKQNKSKPEEASIIGLHRGVVILQVKPDVVKIGVRITSLSEWNKEVKGKSKINIWRGQKCIELPSPPSTPETDYNELGNLDTFPFLISLEATCKILHIEKDKCNAKNLSDLGIEFNPTGTFVKKSSLEKYLGIAKPEKEQAKP